MLEDGLTAPAKVRKLASDHLELTIHEGRKRQVKRMLEAVGHPRATRSSAWRSGRCGSGRWSSASYRELTPAEIERLRALG